MAWQLTPHSFLYFSTTLVTLGTAWLAWQRRNDAGGSVLDLMMLMGAEYAFCVGIEGTLVAQDLKILGSIIPSQPARNSPLQVIDCHRMARYDPEKPCSLDVLIEQADKLM